MKKQTLFVGIARNRLKISSISLLPGAGSAIFDVLSMASQSILGRVAMVRILHLEVAYLQFKV